MSVLLHTLTVWRICALVVWAGITIGAVDVVAHILDPHPHRHALQQRRHLLGHHRNERK